MTYRRTNNFNIYLSEAASYQIASRDKITAALRSENVIAFDIYNDETLIGFAMFCEFNQSSHFLWNYAIDSRYQNKHFGTEALQELLLLMKEKYKSKRVTTTCLWKNSHAKHVYERIGFAETDVVDEDDIHEINMEIMLDFY